MLDFFISNTRLFLQKINTQKQFQFNTINQLMGLLIEPALDYLIESYLLSDKVSTCLYPQREELKNDFLNVDHS